jgi:hypothetical protein
MLTKGQTPVLNQLPPLKPNRIAMLSVHTCPLALLGAKKPAA